MATKNFKGFQLVALATFNGAGFTKDKNTLYFVRTSGEKGNGTDGFLYFNGKKYGTAEDAKAALITRYGDIKIGEKDATIAEYVAEQLKDIKGVTKTDFDAVRAESAANKAAIEKLNGTEDAEGSVAKAVKDAKTSLVGTATKGYQTLGELETKIKEEAVRAKAAEQANATAAAAAKTAADNAQATADGKVKSVEGTDTVVATTNDHAVSVSLKTSDKGNVKFTQDNDGLSANVTIPEATVTAVKEGDKVLALDGTKLTSTISLSVDTSEDGEGKKYIRLKGIGGADLGKIDTANFVKDGMLDGSALYTATAATGTVTINTKEYTLKGLTAKHTYIVLVWNTDAAKDAMAIDVTSLIDIYTAKANGGLKLEDHAFSVDTDKIATVESVSGVTSRVSILEGKVATIEGEGVGSIKKAVADEASRAQAAEKKNADAIATLNGGDTVEGSVDKKIKDALEAGAVTLEVKNDDKYLGVTSATTGGKGTVYTLASKADEINKAIEAEAKKVKVSVASAEGAYVTASVDEAGRVITLSETVQEVATSSKTAKGLAEASDVKNYVDGKVSSKNVTATGDTYVSATADANKVTVAATEALKTAVTKANSAVQSVNGKSGSAVELSGADIKTNQKVGENATATVNTVLADIYTKLGVVVKADGKTIKENADNHTLSVNLEAKETAQANGHVALEHGEDGALYGVMYYSGDDVDVTE